MMTNESSIALTVSVKTGKILKTFCLLRHDGVVEEPITFPTGDNARIGPLFLQSLIHMEERSPLSLSYPLVETFYSLCNQPLFDCPHYPQDMFSLNFIYNLTEGMDALDAVNGNEEGRNRY